MNKKYFLFPVLGGLSMSGMAAEKMRGELGDNLTRVKGTERREPGRTKVVK